MTIKLNHDKLLKRTNTQRTQTGNRLTVLVILRTESAVYSMRSQDGIAWTDRLVGWLEFNSTFSTKKLHRALRKLKFVKQFYFI